MCNLHMPSVDICKPVAASHRWKFDILLKKSVLVLGKIPKTTGNTAQKFGNARLVFPEADRCNGSLFGL